VSKVRIRGIRGFHPGGRARGGNTAACQPTGEVGAGAARRKGKPPSRRDTGGVYCFALARCVTVALSP